MPRYVTIDDAAVVLNSACRVLVVSCSGGGKSTLSLQLANLCQMNLISIDRDVRWLAGWIERDKHTQRALIAELIKQDRWVMDGSGSSTFDLRLPRADLVLWIKVPRRIALAGLAHRVIRSYGSVRPEMAEGCPERVYRTQRFFHTSGISKRNTPLGLLAGNFSLNLTQSPQYISRTQ